MAAITCELCGSNDVVKQGEFFICQHCGTKYSLEDAKKLIGTVQIDNSNFVEKYLENGRRARAKFDWAEAEKYYNLVEQNAPQNIEALFYSAYAKMRVAMQNLNLSDNNTTNKIVASRSVLTNSISLLDDYFDIQQEPRDRKVIEDAVNDILKLNESGDGDLRYGGTSGFEHSWIKGQVVSPLCGDKLNETIDNLIEKYKQANIDYTYLTNIKSRISVKKAEASKGCYVATAVYGSYDCPQVWTLRRYRDYTLADTWYGRAFIHTYYAVSPTLVKWFGETEWFKNMWKPKLDRMVKKLNEKGVADTPYLDRDW